MLSDCRPLRGQSGGDRLGRLRPNPMKQRRGCYCFIFLIRSLSVSLRLKRGWSKRSTFTTNGRVCACRRRPVLYRQTPRRGIRPWRPSTLVTKRVCAQGSCRPESPRSVRRSAALPRDFWWPGAGSQVLDGHRAAGGPPIMLIITGSGEHVHPPAGRLRGAVCFFNRHVDRGRSPLRAFFERGEIRHGGGRAHTR